LTVLDGQLDSDTETLPVTSGLGDIFTDLCRTVSLLPLRLIFDALHRATGVRTLRRQTEGTDLGGERGGGTDFTTGRTEVDDLDLGGIELGSFMCR
jgi:hypothetical protein